MAVKWYWPGRRSASRNCCTSPLSIHSGPFTTPARRRWRPWDLTEIHNTEWAIVLALPHFIALKLQLTGNFAEPAGREVAPGLRNTVSIKKDLEWTIRRAQEATVLSSR